MSYEHTLMLIVPEYVIGYTKDIRIRMNFESSSTNSDAILDYVVVYDYKGDDINDGMVERVCQAFIYATKKHSRYSESETESCSLVPFHFGDYSKIISEFDNCVVSFLWGDVESLKIKENLTGIVPGKKEEFLLTCKVSIKNKNIKSTAREQLDSNIFIELTTEKFIPYNLLINQIDINLDWYEYVNEEDFIDNLKKLIDTHFSTLNDSGLSILTDHSTLLKHPQPSTINGKRNHLGALLEDHIKDHLGMLSVRLERFINGYIPPRIRNNKYYRMLDLGG